MLSKAPRSTYARNMLKDHCKAVNYVQQLIGWRQAVEVLGSSHLQLDSEDCLPFRVDKARTPLSSTRFEEVVHQGRIELGLHAQKAGLFVAITARPIGVSLLYNPVKKAQRFNLYRDGGDHWIVFHRRQERNKPISKALGMLTHHPSRGSLLLLPGHH